MFLDSHFWKREIEKELKRIKKIINRSKNINNEEDFDIKNFIELQKFTIYVAIITRKLIESRKISDELRNKNYSLKKYTRTETLINFLNCYEIEKIYDLKNEKKSSISILTISNSIIHSFHFLPSYLSEDNNFLNGFYFSSDNDKENGIYLITFNQFFEILNDIIYDFITYVEFDDNKVKKVLKQKKN